VLKTHLWTVLEADVGMRKHPKMMPAEGNISHHIVMEKASEKEGDSNKTN